MIQSIQLVNFKCYQDEHIPLGPLTLLSGINGMGKSTVLQSLLLLRQSAVVDRLGELGACLNGPLVNLGQADDLLFDFAEDDRIRLKITGSDGCSLVFDMNAIDKKKRHLSLKNAPTPESLGLINKPGFYYLQAERLGPRIAAALVAEEAVKYSRVGKSGEFAPHLLATNERKPLAIKELMHPKQPEAGLRFQVEAWLSEIGQEPRIRLNTQDDQDLVSMKFSFVRGGLESNPYRATNVGFGLSYSLPVFVACLSAEPGDLILIENPEAHLHPKGQAALGRFLSLVAANGVQVIVETHSDHILNGVRIAAKTELIRPEDVKIHFFDHDKERNSTCRITPKLDRDGRLDQWPEGFFDEWEKSLSDLL
ncbi:MAG: DUF3696 domain-containing protein [bacterium]|nr:DUF3696 domain-containing protein [bacterium]